METKLSRREHRAKRLPNTVRCMLYASDGHYYAECIDLNLLVRADSADAAKAALEQEMRDYTDLVREMGDPAHLVRRPSPIVARLRYLLCPRKWRQVWPKKD